MHFILFSFLILSCALATNVFAQENENEYRLTRNLPEYDNPTQDLSPTLDYEEQEDPEEISDISENLRRLRRSRFPSRSQPKASSYVSPFRKGRCRPSQAGSTKCKKRFYSYGGR
ncbi:unnamed protein product [Orchesella dallaii]|uniref:Uncharacterized protein n=1 Tax=Orchesella dallaii TaxID=48710 RepID=A0ABP1QNJ3_9HEXA